MWLNDFELQALMLTSVKISMIRENLVKLHGLVNLLAERKAWCITRGTGDTMVSSMYALVTLDVEMARRHFIPADPPTSQHLVR